MNADYTHRHNTDGTVDSICMFCFQTVGTALKECELEASERKHRCLAKSREQNA